MSSGGHIRRRGRNRNSWELKYEVERTEGGRRTRYKTVRGSRKDAQAELNRLLAQIADGIDIAPSKLTVETYVFERIGQWAASGVVGPKSAERYRGLAAGQIAPFLGSKLLQRLSPRDIEAWHTTLQNTVRRDGKGKLSTRTIGHAHRVLSKALRDAVRLELVPRNVASIQGAPKVEADELRILTAEQVAALPALLDGHELAAPTVVALFTGMRRGENSWLGVGLRRPRGQAHQGAPIA